MWDDDELNIVDEKTKVFDRDEAPRSGPILLTNPLLDAEIIEVVEIRTSWRPPPPRRRRRPPEPAPSLVDATPTRPGQLGYSNELLFVEVTPPAFTLDSIGQPAEDDVIPDDDRSSISLEPTIFDASMMRAKPRASMSLKLGALGAVLLAIVSYVQGPLNEPAQAGRAAFLTRSGENILAEAKTDSALATNKPKKAKTRRRARRAAPADEAAVEDLPQEDQPHADPVEGATEGVSETEEELTEALAPEFNVSATKTAMAVAAANASACGDGTTTGNTRVSVTFARSGSATSAMVDPGSGFGGTSIGSCIARVMRQTSVPAYSGEIVTVRSRVKIK
jgi:hypothetical protein